MVRQLVGQKVIYAVWHDRSIRIGWCEAIERFWPEDPRPWPHITDTESGKTFVTFGPVVLYNEQVFEELGWIGMGRPQEGGFERCWAWLMSVDWNCYESLERK